MTRTPYESAASLTSHNATDPAELNIVCHSKPNPPNQTDSNIALLLYSSVRFSTSVERRLEWALVILINV